MKKTIIYTSSIAILLFAFSCRKTTGFVLKECGFDNTSGYTNFDSIGSTMFIPNGFTPNNNGLNDCWRVMGNRISPTGFSLEVKHRNKVLFSTTNLAESWNGTNKSGDCPGAGKYTYKVSATGKDGVKYNQEGEVTILLSTFLIAFQTILP